MKKQLVAVLALVVALAGVMATKYVLNSKPKHKAGECLLLESKKDGLKAGLVILEVTKKEDKTLYHVVLLTPMGGQEMMLDAKKADETIAKDYIATNVNCQTGEPLSK